MFHSLFSSSLVSSLFPAVFSFSPVNWIECVFWFWISCASWIHVPNEFGIFVVYQFLPSVGLGFVVRRLISIRNFFMFYSRVLYPAFGSASESTQPFHDTGTGTRSLCDLMRKRWIYEVPHTVTEAKEWFQQSEGDPHHTSFNRWQKFSRPWLCAQNWLHKIENCFFFFIHPLLFS